MCKVVQSESGSGIWNEKRNENHNKGKQKII